MCRIFSSKPLYRPFPTPSLRTFPLRIGFPFADLPQSPQNSHAFLIPSGASFALRQTPPNFLQTGHQTLYLLFPKHSSFPSSSNSSFPSVDLRSLPCLSRQSRHKVGGRWGRGNLEGAPLALSVSGRFPRGNFRRLLVLLGWSKPPTQTTVSRSRPLMEIQWGHRKPYEVCPWNRDWGSTLASSQGPALVPQRSLSVVTASHRSRTVRAGEQAAAPPNVGERGCPPEGDGAPPLLSVVQTYPPCNGDAKTDKGGDKQMPLHRGGHSVLVWPCPLAGDA